MNIIKCLWLAFLFFAVAFEISAIEILAGGTQSAAIDGEGNLYLWGKRQGEGTFLQPVSPKDSHYMHSIRNGAVSEDGGVFVDTDNNIWGIGRNLKRMLGRNNECSLSGLTLIEKPSTLLPTTTILKISLTAEFMLILDGDDLVWALPDHCFGPYHDNPRPVLMKKVQELTEIKDIATGTGHALALDRDGNVFSWGWQQTNGRGDILDEQFGPQSYHNIPTRIPELSNIKCIAAGSNHSLAVEEGGTLWSFGKWENNALGIVDQSYTRSNRLKPEIVAIDAIIEAVAAGAECSFAIDHEGGVWAWGLNTDGRFGLGTSGWYPGITKVNFECRIIQIAVGASHTLFLDQEGKVWGCGKNDFKQLGDLSPRIAFPEVIVGLPEMILTKRSHKIKSGNTYSAFPK